jgi:tRNA dimethylallyltransferase
MADKEGNEVLHGMLAKVDEKSAKDIHPNNVKRVIRALEYFHQTGKKISEHNEEQSQNVSPYNFVYFVLNDDRKLLYERIDRRVDEMFEEGLEQEVKRLIRGLQEKVFQCRVSDIRKCLIILTACMILIQPKN